MRFFRPLQKVYAHCDIPCGIYDPAGAQVAALTVIRMMDLLVDANEPHEATRLTAVKEEHAERCKHEVRVIWGDYFKAEHFKKHSNLDKITHKVMELASEARQGMDRKKGVELLQEVNKFAEIFWATKGIETKSVKSPHSIKEEIVIPDL